MILYELSEWVSFYIVLYRHIATIYCVILVLYIVTYINYAVSFAQTDRTDNIVYTYIYIYNITQLIYNLKLQLNIKTNFWWTFKYQDN